MTCSGESWCSWPMEKECEKYHISHSKDLLTQGVRGEIRQSWGKHAPCMCGFNLSCSVSLSLHFNSYFSRWTSGFIFKERKRNAEIRQLLRLDPVSLAIKRGRLRQFRYGWHQVGQMLFKQWRPIEQDRLFCGTVSSRIWRVSAFLRGCTVKIFFPSVLWHYWLGDRNGIRPVKCCVLVCWWWWFDWRFARLIAPVVTTTSIILCFNKHWLNQVHLENGR